MRLPLDLPSLIGKPDENGCWPWLGHIDRKGYGRAGKRGPAYRAVYELLVGPIPPGMTLDHLCYVTRCVNPGHLEVVTQSENSRRQRSASKTHCVNGHLYDEKNTYIRPAGNSGNRDCRACTVERQRRYQERKRGAA